MRQIHDNSDLTLKHDDLDSYMGQVIVFTLLGRDRAFGKVWTTKIAGEHTITNEVSPRGVGSRSYPSSKARPTFRFRPATAEEAGKVRLSYGERVN